MTIIGSEIIRWAHYNPTLINSRLMRSSVRKLKTEMVALDVEEVDLHL